VEYGTVITTDKDILFISADIERFSEDGKSILSLSVRSPMYKSMKGKRVGEIFEYEENPIV
jgi:hypothetical protein